MRSEPCFKGVPVPPLARGEEFPLFSWGAGVPGPRPPSREREKERGNVMPVVGVYVNRGPAAGIFLVGFFRRGLERLYRRSTS